MPYTIGNNVVTVSASGCSVYYTPSAITNWQPLGQATNVSYMTANTQSANAPTWATPTNTDVNYGYGYAYGYDTNAYNAQIVYNYQANVTGMGRWYADIETQEQAISRQEYIAAEEKKRIAAESKAEELLLMCLSEEQRESYLKKGYIEVGSEKSNKFRIRKGWAKNVEKLNKDGKPECIYCIHPGILVPTCDNMLAQKLMLETDEANFIANANKWSV